MSNRPWLRELQTEACLVENSGLQNIDLTSQTLSIDFNSIRELSDVEVEIELSTEDDSQILSLQEVPLTIGLKHNCRGSGNLPADSSNGRFVL